MPVTLPLPQWTPDQPPFNNPGATIARNVLPLSQTAYGPLQEPVALAIAALPETPIGFFSLLDRQGNAHLFAGSATKLYHFKTGDTAFNDVSQVGKTYTGTPETRWEFTLFGNSVIATNGSDAPQTFFIDEDTNFSDLNSNRAPYGKYAAVVHSDFLMFGNYVDPLTNLHHPQGVRWSSIGNPTLYPDLGSDVAAELLSDFQDLRSDIGHIHGLASNLQNSDVAIFFDYSIYIGLWTGSPTIFSFQVAQGAAGCRVPGSIVSHKGYAYYLGPAGFYKFDGSQVNPIGAQRIDEWFFHDPIDGADPTFIHLTQGTASPTDNFIIWAYCGPNSNGSFNRLLVYNWILDRWSYARVNTHLLGKSLSSGFSLDQLDQFGTMDSLVDSLDAERWKGGIPYLLVFDGANQVCNFMGPSLEADLETLEAEPVPSMRCRVTSARPLVDSGAASVSIGLRNRLQDEPVFGNAVTTNIWGECPVREDGRYLRARINIPANTAWQSVQGVEVDLGKSTKR